MFLLQKYVPCLTLLALFCLLSAEEEIYSAQNGLWSDAATWNGERVPGIGDRAIIKHAVTIDVNADVGHSPNDALTARPALTVESEALLTVDAGVTLTCRGDLLARSRIMLSAGAKLIFNSEKAKIPEEKEASIGAFYWLMLVPQKGQQVHLQSAGTAKAPCVISSLPLNRAAIRDGTRRYAVGPMHGKINFRGLSAGGIIVGSYLHMHGMGDGFIPAWKFSPDTDEGLLLKHAVFEQCGKVSPRPYAADSKPYRLRLNACRWINSMPMPDELKGRNWNIFTAVAPPQSDCRLLHCDFDDIVLLSKPNAWVIEDCIFRGSVNRPKGKWHEGRLARFKRNLVVWPEKYDKAGLHLPYGDTYEDCIFVMDFLSHNNPHYMSVSGMSGTARIKGCLFWFSGPNDHSFGPEGDGPYTSDAASGQQQDNTLIIERCIFLPNTKGPDAERHLSANITSGVFPTKNSQVIVRRNTAFSGGPGGVCIGETHPTVKGALSYVKSNLFVGSVKNDGIKMHDFGLGVEGAVRAQDCDYNAGFRLRNGSNYIEGKTGKGYSKLKLVGDLAIGEHDVDDVDPQFVDPHRNPVSWSKSLLGDGAKKHGTMEHAMNSLYPTGKYSIQDLIDYIRKGFQPQNNKLKNAGDPDDGSPDIGAVDLE